MTWRSPGLPEAVEVLPRAEFDDEHLPGAISLPLKSLTAGHQRCSAISRRRDCSSIHPRRLTGLGMSPRTQARPATPGTIRGDDALESDNSLVHGPGVPAPARSAIKIVFLELVHPFAPVGD
jgi:hypothetical protein